MVDLIFLLAMMSAIETDVSRICGAVTTLTSANQCEADYDRKKFIVGGFKNENLNELCGRFSRMVNINTSVFNKEWILHVSDGMNYSECEL